MGTEVSATVTHKQRISLPAERLHNLSKMILNQAVNLCEKIDSISSILEHGPQILLFLDADDVCMSPSHGACGDYSVGAQFES